MFSILRRITILVMVVGVALTFVSSNSFAASPLTVGTPQEIDFTSDGFVSDVLIDIKKGWLNTHDQIILHVRIFGVNGAPFIDHGSQVVLLSETEVFGTDKDIAFVSFVWTADNTPRDVNETYTVCAEIIFPNDRVFGGEKCASFGPF
jgi:hypothetical protein